jgi:hypothetical protein
MRDNSNPGSVEHFAKKIDVTATCWWWTDWRSPAGYGGYKIGKQKWIAHRLMWTIVNGPIPKGMVVRHLCRNPACVRPDHLAIGTQRDNMHDAIKDGTHVSLQRHQRYVAKTEEERAADERRYRVNEREKRNRTKQLKGYARGERVPTARLTEDAVHDIRSRHAAGETYTVIAKSYTVAIGTVRLIVLRHTWKHVD